MGWGRGKGNRQKKGRWLARGTWNQCEEGGQARKGIMGWGWLGKEDLANQGKEA